MTRGNVRNPGSGTPPERGTAERSFSRRQAPAAFRKWPTRHLPRSVPSLPQEPDPTRLALKTGDLSWGNQVQLLRDGEQAFPRMLEAIGRARRFILLEMYTFADDFIGRRFARALADRSRAGVDVRVLYDSFGSRETRREFFGWMRSQGIQVQAFHPMNRFLLGWRYRSRSHRKLLVVDGHTAFLGGLNLTREFATPADGGGGWRDTALEIKGPAVADLTRLSLDYGASEGKRPRQTEIRRSLLSLPESAGSPVLILGSPRLSDRRVISRHLRFAFRNARRRIWIANSYFLPSRAVQGELRRAARRGVDVRLLVPRASDAPPVQYASERLFDRFLKWGVRIYQWAGPMMHAKTAVVDGQWSTVGSYNMDTLSNLLNDELTAIVLDRNFAATLERMFEEDFRISTEVVRREWKTRGWARRMMEEGCYLFRIVL